MKIGYRRVSSVDQNLDRQDLGTVDKVFEEKLSGASSHNRPALLAMIDFAREGDEVIVYSIDRLARDLRDCQDIVARLNDKGVSVAFLSENLKFTASDDDPFSKLQLHLMSAFAEFERAIIRRRQREGIEKAKAKGVYKGRPPSINAGKITELCQRGFGPSDIARELGISRASVYRLMKSGIG
jgi:DNA invertase Pin-like site-specific DNA recombinase